MKYQHTFIAFVLVVINAVSAFAQQDNDSVVIQGYQFASASKGVLSSTTMQLTQEGGQFKVLKDNIHIFQLSPGDYWSCRFKLPKTAFDVKVIITYKNQNEDIKGRISLNGKNLPEEQTIFLKGKEELIQKEIHLDEFLWVNELRIISLEQSLQILNVKIKYSYRMPSCTVGDVTVKLLSPDSDKDVLGSDLKIEWSGTGSCEKGWVTIQYKDGVEWKTIPGAEALDIGDDEWKEKSHGQFVWKNHGLQSFPELKIEYQEDKSPNQREERLAAKAKAKAEQAERERKAQADRIANEAKELLEKEKYDAALVRIDNALDMYPSDYKYDQLKRKIKKAKTDQAERERQAKADRIANEAQGLLKNKEYSKALAKINEALEMYSDNERYKKIKQEIEVAIDPLLTEGKFAGDRITKKINGVEFAFRWCPADTFMMGSPEKEDGHMDDETQHQVILTNGFWIMETEVTQRQWKAIMANNPSSFQGDEDLPVENVSWNECQNFCIITGLQLPTEAQWEYACRAGTTDRFAGDLNKMAWYYINSNNITHPVGGKYPNAYWSKKPNSWGIYDMHGNVWEWCADLYEKDYPRGIVRDPQGAQPGIKATQRVARGGGWKGATGNCRSACRNAYEPKERYDFLGFRCVFNPKQHETINNNVQNNLTDNGTQTGERKVFTINGVEFAFRWCPNGTFKMGSPETEKKRDEDEKQHNVTFTKGFWMMETEVTQKQWKSVMYYNPSYFIGDNLPVENVSWNNCQAFCEKCKALGMPVQLPTEAQWEYACRANGKDVESTQELMNIAWFKMNSESKTHDVKSKVPNEWNLYDMHGNVMEWCADWYQKDYQLENIIDPIGPLTGDFRVIRGSHFDSQNCRSAMRNYDISERKNHVIGFRCVINPK